LEVRDWALSKLLFHVCFVVNHSRTFGGLHGCADARTVGVAW